MLRKNSQPGWQQVRCDISQRRRRLLELSTLPSDLGSGTLHPQQVWGGQQGVLAVPHSVQAGWAALAHWRKGWSPCSVLLKLPPEYCSSYNHTGINRAHQSMSNFEEVKYWGFKLSCQTKLKSNFGHWPTKKKWLKSQMRKNEAGLFFAVTPSPLSILQFFSLRVNPLAVTKMVW